MRVLWRRRRLWRWSGLLSKRDDDASVDRDLEIADRDIVGRLDVASTEEQEARSWLRLVRGRGVVRGQDEEGQHEDDRDDSQRASDRSDTIRHGQLHLTQHPASAIAERTQQEGSLR